MKRFSGFTLIEILLAVTILAVLIVVFTTTLVNLLQGRKAAEAYRQDRDIGLMIAHIMEETLLHTTEFSSETNPQPLAQTNPPGTPGLPNNADNTNPNTPASQGTSSSSTCVFKGQENVSVADGTDSIQFLTTSPFFFPLSTVKGTNADSGSVLDSPTSSTREELVSYSKVTFQLQHNDKDMYDLVETIYPYNASGENSLNSSSSSGQRQETLYSKVLGLTLEYYDGKQWVRSWDCQKRQEAYQQQQNQTPSSPSSSSSSNGSTSTPTPGFQLLPSFVRFTLRYLPLDSSDKSKVQEYHMVVPIFTGSEETPPTSSPSPTANANPSPPDSPQPAPPSSN